MRLEEAQNKNYPKQIALPPTPPTLTSVLLQLTLSHDSWAQAAGGYSARERNPLQAEMPLCIESHKTKDKTH